MSSHRIAVIACLLVFGLVAEAQFPSFKNPNYAPGRDVMVHLFEWKWNDIALECERFLGPNGFAGVQVSPVTENIIVQSRPWWERYQPISYNWITRSGNEEEFRKMVWRCNQVGIRIYVDVLLNHMSGDHEKVLGTGGSTAIPNERRYQAIPYGPNDFHSPCEIKDYSDPYQVRYCELVGLHDLDQHSEYVRGKVVEMLNRLIDAGVAGFRIDAAKHMWPEDLKAIYSRLKTLNTSHGFPDNSHPYIYQEVINNGPEAVSKYEYNPLGAVTEFRYGAELSNAFKGGNDLKWLQNFGEAWALLPSQDALVFIDNHDNQRGHGGAGSILTHRSSKLYKMAVAFMLAYPYGNPRVMSSFAFSYSDQGPPADEKGDLLSPVIMSDGRCDDSWICEHRWPEIYRMVHFRNIVNGTGITSWWDNGKNQIAFSRGDRAFVAFNVENTNLRARIKTSLPSGIYCDIISGVMTNERCTGKIIEVDHYGEAWIEILVHDQQGVVAIHQNARIVR